ncbi:hypothetical protein FO440_20605 [Mucilaginibacter corticis]|uniref:Uncharacterized protein n=1 Tax=Mucilaginibacter corticis TaxID=2597670 RepID=A0A556MG78_9SPHI|nr:hypothetical protein [Mucilaginibacter corticis]TSJ38903.1 hypothetical protein FO440_20605 [Mucilaginibacter corticis]
MKKAAFLLVVFLLITIVIHAQTTKSDNVILRVLRLNHVGKTYKLNTEDSTITYLRYLGKVRTTKGKAYKILTSTWIWGFSHRATNRILVYTDNNSYLGNYYLTTTDDMPNYIKNNKLVFLNKGQDCDSRLRTYVDFHHGIPKQFFRKCKGDGGDIYAFSKD